VLDILPAGGISDIRSSEAWPWYRRLLDISRHLILPTFAYAYGSFAYLSGQIRNSMIENLQSDFVRTGRAKGLSESVLAWKHAFRNSLLPLITISGQILPGLIGGSVILETIFSIPGMGLLAWQALNYRDYPLMIALFMLSGLLTLVGLLLSDMLYPLADPRIRFDTNESGR
jgi:peptide/nickel transport system permease protein